RARCSIGPPCSPGRPRGRGGGRAHHPHPAGLDWVGACRCGRYGWGASCAFSRSAEAIMTLRQRLRRDQAASPRQRLRLCVTAASGRLACVSTALSPYPALSACGSLDLGACVDAAEYSFYYGLAGMGWAVDRTLLQLAYQLDQFRWYLVETAFTSAYQILTSFL